MNTDETRIALIRTRLRLISEHRFEQNGRFVDIPTLHAQLDMLTEKNAEFFANAKDDIAYLLQQVTPDIMRKQ